MTDGSSFNQDVAASCSDLPLYRGEMTLIPHQGDTSSGTGSIALFCGGAQRHLRVRFEQTDGKPRSPLPGSADGSLGSGTTFMRLPIPGPFFVFVTSGRGQREVVGESKLITADPRIACDSIELHLLNGLIPVANTGWDLGDWVALSSRTKCAFDLTRLSLPIHEINLTHQIDVRRKDGRSFCWADVESSISRFLSFLTFCNCTAMTAPVIYGRVSGRVVFFRFEAPKRTLPTNQRSWATSIDQTHLASALTLFMTATDNPFRLNIMQRAIRWKTLADLARYESSSQALLAVQLLLEMLSYVVLVEEAGVLGKDGYSKLPASDRITLLCGQTDQSVSLPFEEVEGLRAFCTANSIGNIGEFITALRNKLIHPTRKNREYLEKVPPGLKELAITAGLQIASLVLLKGIGYSGVYFDTNQHKVTAVPWSR